MTNSDNWNYHLVFIFELSPCIWGALNESIILNAIFRIIPMYMGSTETQVKLEKLAKNHPHVYGEH